MDLLPYDPPGRFGREPDWNAFVELHNGVVAAFEAPADFGSDDADRIGRQRGVDLRQAFSDERLGLYTQLFDEARAAGGPGAHAMRLLAAAAETLSLTSADLAPLHEHAYGDAVSAVLADDRLSVAERLHLYGLQTDLGLAPGRAEAIYRAPARARLLRVVAQALSDGEMPPEQMHEVAAAAEALGVPIDAALAGMLSTAVSRWAARTGPLPVLEAPTVTMRAGEQAHAEVPARWVRITGSDLRDVFQGRLSRDPTRQQKLFPTRRFVPEPRPARLVVTSQRLVVVDPGRPPLDVLFARIRETVVFSDGLLFDVDRASRRLALELDDETQVVGTLLERLVPARAEAPGGAAWWRPLVDPAEAWSLSVASFGWSLPGRVRTENAHIVLRDATSTVRIGSPLLERVTRLDKTVAIELDRRAGWVIRFQDHADAEALHDWIARQIEHR